MWDRKKNETDIGIVTALDIERDAINDILGLNPIVDKEDNDCYYGVVESKKSGLKFNIVHYQTTDIGNIDSTITTMYILNWNPDYVFIVGIAEGIKSNDVKIGDILVSKGIVFYSSTKLADETITRPEFNSVNSFLLRKFKHYPTRRKDKSWLDINQKLKNTLKKDKISTKIHYEYIFSGESVIKEKKTKKKKKSYELLKFAPKATETEMESYGAHQAVSSKPKPPLIITLRCVSDLIDAATDKLEEKDRYHELAAEIISTYLMSFLINGSLKSLKKKLM